MLSSFTSSLSQDLTLRKEVGSILYINLHLLNGRLNNTLAIKVISYITTFNMITIESNKIQLVQQEAIEIPLEQPKAI